MALLSDEFAALYADDNSHFPPQWAIPDEYRTARDRIHFDTLGEQVTDGKRPGEGEDNSNESVEPVDDDAAAATEVKEDGDARNGMLDIPEPDAPVKGHAESGDPKTEKAGESPSSSRCPVHPDGIPASARLPPRRKYTTSQTTAPLTSPTLQPPPAKDGGEHPLSLIVIPGVQLDGGAEMANPNGVRQYTCAQWRDGAARNGNEEETEERQNTMTATLKQLLESQLLDVPPLQHEGSASTSSPKLVGCLYYDGLNSSAATLGSVSAGILSPPGAEYGLAAIGTGRARSGGRGRVDSGRLSVSSEDSSQWMYGQASAVAAAAPSTYEVMGRNIGALAVVREEMELLDVAEEPGIADYSSLLEFCNAVSLPLSHGGAGTVGGSSSPFLPLPSGSSSPNSPSLLSPSPPPLQFSEPPNKMSLFSKFGKLGGLPGSFNSPHGFCSGLREELIVADTGNHRIQVRQTVLSLSRKTNKSISFHSTQVFDYSGNLYYWFGHPGKEDGMLWYPRKVAVMRNNGRFVICDRGTDRSRMQVFTPDGYFCYRIELKFIDIVAGLAVSPTKEEIIVVDSVKPTIFVISESGNLLK